MALCERFKRIGPAIEIAKQNVQTAKQFSAALAQLGLRAGALALSPTAALVIPTQAWRESPIAEEWIFASAKIFCR